MRRLWHAFLDTIAGWVLRSFVWALQEDEPDTVKRGIFWKVETWMEESFGFDQFEEVGWMVWDRVDQGSSQFSLIESHIND